MPERRGEEFRPRFTRPMPTADTMPPYRCDLRGAWLGIGRFDDERVAALRRSWNAPDGMSAARAYFFR